MWIIISMLQVVIIVVDLNVSSGYMMINCVYDTDTSLPALVVSDPSI